MYVHKIFWNLLYVIKYKIFVTPGSPGGWVLEPPGDPGAGNFFCWNPRGSGGGEFFCQPGVGNTSHLAKPPARAPPPQLFTWSMKDPLHRTFYIMNQLHVQKAVLQKIIGTNRGIDREIYQRGLLYYRVSLSPSTRLVRHRSFIAQCFLLS